MELLDELVYGTREAAWPLIRRGLDLQYVQIGLILGVPGIVSGLVEPLFGVLSDRGWRRRLIVGGGCAYGAGLVAFGLSPRFLPLLLASLLLYPASGAFVSLSQTVLMDGAPDDRERNMVRWTAAGAAGAVLGPLLLAALIAHGWGWRPPFLLFALLCSLATLFVLPRIPRSDTQADGHLLAGMRDAVRQLRRPTVLRWLLLLECADLLGDVLLGYLGLYFVDVTGSTPAQGAMAVVVWTGAGLVGTLGILPLLDRLDGLRYLRLSAGAALVLFPGLLLLPGLLPKLAMVAALALTNAGWYPLLQARLYAELPDRSGTAMAAGTIFSTASPLLPFTIGLAAQWLGLGHALWALTFGPIVLLLAVPRSGSSDADRADAR